MAVFLVFNQDKRDMGFYKGDPWKVRENEYAKRWEEEGEGDYITLVRFPRLKVKKARKYVRGIWIDGIEQVKRGYYFPKLPKAPKLRVKQWIKYKC